MFKCFVWKPVGENMGWIYIWTAYVSDSSWEIYCHTRVRTRWLYTPWSFWSLTRRLPWSTLLFRFCYNPVSNHRDNYTSFSTLQSLRLQQLWPPRLASCSWVLANNYKKNTIRLTALKPDITSFTTCRESLPVKEFS